MEDKTINEPVKKDVEDAGTQQEELKTKAEVEAKVEEPVAPQVEEVDYEAKIKEKDEHIAKITADKDNYRKMALKYKKDESDEVEPKLSSEEKMRAIVREELFNSEIAKAQREKDDLYSKALNENKELRVALKNFGKSNISVGGSGVEEKKVIDNSISPEKLNELYATADAMGLNRESFVERYKINSRNKQTT